MECKQCGKPVAGRSQYCSESCKTVYNRNKRKPEQVPEHLQPIAVGSGVCVTVGLDDYLSRPEAYVTRREPDKLNWGSWMNMAELEAAGLKANRVAIPGDWDYKGAAIFIPGLPLSMPQEAIA